MSREALVELALDHLTVADTTPSQLVEVAAAAGARAVCMFLQPMEVLPRMPVFELYGDTPERRATRARLDDLGVSIDLVYPFTLAARSEIMDFEKSLETAAYLGAWAVNVLLYDRDPARRFDRFAEFCALARDHGLGVVAEFYPTSQVRSLPEAAELVRRLGASNVGVNVDLLHLMRSGGALPDLGPAHDAIAYGQFCDGPSAHPLETREFEASSQRLYAGEGVFDIAGFAAALPAKARMSVEAPRDDLLAAGVQALERARCALDATRYAIAGGGRA